MAISGTFRVPSLVALATTFPMAAAEIGPTTRPPFSNELYAGARVIGFKCFDQNLDFMKCRAGADDNPTACTAEGTRVHECVYSLYKEIAAKAPKEFGAYAKCLDDQDLRIHRCKDLQDAFETAFYKA